MGDNNMTGASENIREEAKITINSNKEGGRLQTHGFSVIKKNIYTPDDTHAVIDAIVVKNDEYYIITEIR